MDFNLETLSFKRKSMVSVIKITRPWLVLLKTAITDLLDFRDEKF